MAILRLKNQAQILFIIIFQNTAMDTWISTSIKLLFILRRAHVIMKKLRHRLLMPQVFVKPRRSKHFSIFALKDSRGQGKSCIENKLGVRHTSQLSWLQAVCLTAMLSLSLGLWICLNSLHPTTWKKFCLHWNAAELRQNKKTSITTHFRETQPSGTWIKLTLTSTFGAVIPSPGNMRGCKFCSINPWSSFFTRCLDFNVQKWAPELCLVGQSC